METLAQDVLGLTVKAMSVVCPRCHQTKTSLKTVRDKAQKGESWHCDQSCTTSFSAGPGETHEGKARSDAMNEVDGDDDDDDDDTKDDNGDDGADEGPLDMGTLGFATWIVGLDKAPKRRLRVVKRAIASAQKAVEVATTR